MAVATESRPRATRKSPAAKVVRLDFAERRWVLLVALAALGIRLAWVLSVSRPSQFPFNDTVFYDSVANNIAHGDGYTLGGLPTAHWPPGYTLLLAGVYSLFGHHPVAGEIVNAVFGALLVPVIYVVARRWLGRPEARFSAIAVAVLPGTIFFADVLLTETFYTLLLAIFVAWLVGRRPGYGSCALIGVLIGVFPHPRRGIHPPCRHRPVLVAADPLWAGGPPDRGGGGRRRADHGALGRPEREPDARLHPNGDQHRHDDMVGTQPPRHGVRHIPAPLGARSLRQAPDRAEGGRAATATCASRRSTTRRTILCASWC